MKRKKKIDWEDIAELARLKFIVFCVVLVVAVVVCAFLGIDIGGNGGSVPVMIGSQMYLLPT